MSTALLLQYVLPVLSGYAIGSIPFGYLIFYWVKGVDIRTVGSGNIGATNVGRNLGFRYFLLVFLLDLLKGYLPTFGLPMALGGLTGSSPPELGVFVALATILGHNFPIYLKFKGGKGVATSLGALLALNPVASAAAALGFGIVFLATRYVSLSSLVGGLAFIVTYFVRTAEPWNRENRAMTIVTTGLFVLLVGRHHKNISRLLSGTEPRVSLRRRQTETDQRDHRAGRIHSGLLIVLLLVTGGLTGAGYWIIQRSRTVVEINAGPWALREMHREQTGQQRSTRVEFADQGNRLAVLCPRYNRVLLYRVTHEATLVPEAEISVGGRPLAIRAVRDHLVVLQRPPGDDKHLEEGWLEVFDFNGELVRPRVKAGYYPDDLAVTPDGRLLLVLNSGRGEGDARKPLPSLNVYETEFDRKEFSPVGRVDLEPTDDPDRLSVSGSGARVAISLKRTSQTVAVDLSNPMAPRLAGRTELGTADAPYLSFAPDSDWIVMPVAEESEVVPIDVKAADARKPGDAPGMTDRSGLGSLVFTRPDESVLELVQDSPRRTLGRFPLWGPLNLAGTRPTGLAYSPERGLIAVATKPGTVHLIALRSRLAPDSKPEASPRITTTTTYQDSSLR